MSNLGLHGEQGTSNLPDRMDEDHHHLCNLIFHRLQTPRFLSSLNKCTDFFHTPTKPWSLSNGDISQRHLYRFVVPDASGLNLEEDVLEIYIFFH
jgi:hypothetical protein